MQAFSKALDASPSGHYLNWSVVHISLTNALIILAMVVIFALALVLPFPGPPDGEEKPTGGGAP
jgi:hypothetical protein